MQVVRKTHLRLHNAEVNGDVSQKSRIATGRNPVDVPTPRLVVDGLRDIEQRRQRPSRGPTGAPRRRARPLRAEIVEEERVAGAVAILVLHHPVIVSVQ